MPLQYTCVTECHHAFPPATACFQFSFIGTVRSHIVYLASYHFPSFLREVAAVRRARRRIGGGAYHVGTTTSFASSVVAPALACVVVTRLCSHALRSSDPRSHCLHDHGNSKPDSEASSAAARPRAYHMLPWPSYHSARIVNVSFQVCA